MNSKGCGRKQPWPSLMYYPSICLGLRKTTRNLSQDSQSLSQNLNPEHPKYEAGVLPTQLLHLVTNFSKQIKCISHVAIRILNIYFQGNFVMLSVVDSIEG
jgi:hypothetical protein